MKETESTRMRAPQPVLVPRRRLGRSVTGPALSGLLAVLLALLMFIPPVFAQEGGDAMTQTVQAGGELPGNPSIQLEQVADGLADPVNVASPPNDDRLFVVERIGRIRIIDGDGQLLDEPFLDISNTVKTDFLEQGLLGLAFHPNYSENGRFFIYYVDWNTNGDTFLVEYHVAADDANKADPESAHVLLTQDEPYINHNGGTLHFGPDGYLYVAMGDGGLAGDPYDNAQNISTRLGSILRLDVDSNGPGAYAVPADNPFAQGVIAGRPDSAADYHPGAAGEIWAYGLRNPWQFSFDNETGDLYIADVGQNQWEEVNFQPADSEGGVNYGWDHLEASHCYPNDVESCDSLGTLPIAEYNHDDGSCSITGGGVYRGPDASLDGIYFNSDFCSGKVWGLAQVDGSWQYAELLDTDLSVTGAGTDTDGNVYFTTCNCEYSRDYDPLANPQGAVWRVVADTAGSGNGDTSSAGDSGMASGQDESTSGDTSSGDTSNAATSSGDAASSDTATATESANGSVNTVDVELVEWSINMPTELPAGETTFVVTNAGEFVHNFEIVGQGIDESLARDINAGESLELTVDLAPGEYDVYCPVGNHASQGMELTLTVN